jgi:hypothetical protein
MTTFLRLSGLRCAALVGLGAALVSACDATPTTAVVENGLSVSVYKLWWGTTLFSSAVPPGATSEPERIVSVTDVAYALLAPGWSPESGDGPAALIAVESATALDAPAHQRSTISVTEDTFVGDCAAGRPLSEEDAQFIVERIFPGDFAGTTYDPATCRASPIAADGGAPDASDGDAGGP